MKILHLIDTVDLASGGPIASILAQDERDYRAAGHVREIASLDPPESPAVEACPVVAHGLGAEVSQTRAIWRRYGVSWRYVRWLQSRLSSYDVVIVNGLWRFTTLGFVLAGGLRHRCVLLVPHGMLDPWFRRTAPVKSLIKQLVWLIADGLVLNRAAMVLFTSEDEAVQAQRAFWPYRPVSRIVPLGIAEVQDRPANVGQHRPELPPTPGRRHVLFLGRLHRKKGIDLLITAFAAIADLAPDLDVVIAGPDQMGLREPLQRQAERLGIAGRIHWPGLLTDGAKWAALRRAEALVLPSHQENFGLVVAEALACGTPVLISDKVNIWRDVVAAGAGFAEADSVAGTERLLRRFIGLTPVTRAAMSRAARVCYETHFRASAATAALIEAIDAAADGCTR